MSRAETGNPPHQNLFPLSKAVVDRVLGRFLSPGSKTRKIILAKEPAVLSLSQPNISRDVSLKAETMAEAKVLVGDKDGQALFEEPTPEEVLSRMAFWSGYFEGILVANRILRKAAAGIGIDIQPISRDVIIQLEEAEKERDIDSRLKQFISDEPALGKHLEPMLESKDPVTLGFVNGVRDFVTLSAMQNPDSIPSMYRR